MKPHQSTMFSTITALFIGLMGAWLAATVPQASEANTPTEQTVISASASKIYLPLTKSPVQKLGSAGGVSQAVTHDGNYAYVGQGHELVIIDISQAQPSEIGHVRLPGVAGQIEINNGYAYVTTHAGGLAIVDVRDPARPNLAGQWPDGIADMQLQSVLLRGRFAYVNTYQTLFVLDVANPAQIRLLGRYDLPSDAPAYFVKITPHPADDRFVFIKMNTGSNDLYDLRNPQQIRSLNFGVPKHTREGNKFYFLNYDESKDVTNLIVYDMSQPNNPKQQVIPRSESNLYAARVAGFVWKGYWIEHLTNNLNVFLIDEANNVKPKLTLVAQYPLPTCSGGANIQLVDHYMLLFCYDFEGVSTTIVAFDINNVQQIKRVGQGDWPMTGKVSEVSFKQQRVMFLAGKQLATMPVGDLNSNFKLTVFSTAHATREVSVFDHLITLNEQVAVPGITTTLFANTPPFTLTQLYSNTTIPSNEPISQVTISPTLRAAMHGNTGAIVLWSVGITKPVSIITTTKHNGYSVQLLVNADWLLISYGTQIEFWHLADPQQPKLGAVYSDIKPFDISKGYRTIFMIKPNLLLIPQTTAYVFLDITNPSNIRIVKQHSISETQILLVPGLPGPVPTIIQQTDQRLMISMNLRHIDIFDISANLPTHLSMFDLGRDVTLANRGWLMPAMPKFTIYQQQLYVLYPDYLGSVRIWDISQARQPKQLAILTTDASAIYPPLSMLIHPTQPKLLLESAKVIIDAKIIRKFEWIDMSSPSQPVIYHQWQHEQSIGPGYYYNFVYSLPMSFIPNTDTLAIGLGDDGVVFMR